MLTPSIALLAAGTFMGTSGVLAKAPWPVATSVMVLGSGLVVLGGLIGAGPVRWTELAIGPFKGTVQTRDQDFKQFYSEHREQLQRFATMMCGDRELAHDFVREAAARTRLSWTTHASADPLMFMARTLVHWLEQPSIWMRLVSRGSRKRRRWARNGAEQPIGDRALAASLCDLPFPARAALLMDSLLGLGIPAMAEILGRPEDQVRRDIEIALAHIAAAGHDRREAHDAIG